MNLDQSLQLYVPRANATAMTAFLIEKQMAFSYFPDIAGLNDLFRLLSGWRGTQLTDVTAARQFAKSLERDLADELRSAALAEKPVALTARRVHRHRAVPALRQEKKWQYCIDHEGCNRDPKRQEAHGNLHVIDYCSCGAQREAEIGIFQTNYGEWTKWAGGK